jgi:hypothetical protein
LKECIIIDDWVHGLATYLTDAERSKRDLARAAELISKEFSGDAVASKWNELLSELIVASQQVLDPLSQGSAESATKLMQG